MMKEYYEIWVGKIIALNGEKNEKKILHYMSKEKIGKSDNFIVYFQSNLGLDSDLKIGISFT